MFGDAMSPSGPRQRAIGRCWLRRGARYGRSDAPVGNCWVKLGLCRGGESPRQARREPSPGGGVLHLGLNRRALQS